MSKVKLYLGGVAAVAVVVLALMGWHYFFGLTSGRQQEIKHFQSDLVGLKRVVEQYDGNGKVINRFEGRYKIETEGNFISFIHEGNNIKLSGSIMVKEVD